MISKLRKKFIITAFLAVFALLFVILFVINMVNFSLVTSDADKITEMILNKTGNFAEDPMPKNAPGQQYGGEFNKDLGRPMGPSSPETKESTRYFAVKIADGETSVIAYRISIVTEEEAQSWALSLADKKVGWTKMNYRYRVKDTGKEKIVVVIDQSRELGPSYRVLWASLIGGGVGLVVTFLILLPLSKAFVKPIEDNERKQRRFISDAAFEFKTPLSAIDADRKTLELSVGVSEETKGIEKEVKYLIDFTKKLDTLAMIESKKTDKEFCFSALCREISLPYADLFIKSNKKLTVDLQENVYFSGDVVALSELLSTCLENGMKYADSYLIFRMRSGSGRIEMEFVNDAHKVPDGPMDSLFEKFYRSEEVKESGIEGAGIGLSIAKGVVDAHKGRIWAKGEDGKFILKIEL